MGRLVKPATSIQLFCFPHSGSSGAAYARWRRLLPDWIRVSPVEFPGRGRRTREPLETTFDGLIERVAGEVRPEASQPFAFFGHSLGAVVAFELAWRRGRAGASVPALVFAAGSAAPSRRDPERYAAISSDAELRAELERLDGTPASVLADADLMAFTLPILRADFQVAASYRCQGARCIDSAIEVLGGADDTTTPDTLAAWRDHTRAEFGLTVLPGGHFFVQEREPEVLDIVQRRLATLLRDQSSAEPTARPSMR